MPFLRLMFKEHLWIHSKKKTTGISLTWWWSEIGAGYCALRTLAVAFFVRFERNRQCFGFWCEPIRTLGPTEPGKCKIVRFETRCSPELQKMLKKIAQSAFFSQKLALIMECRSKSSQNTGIAWMGGGSDHCLDFFWKLCPHVLRALKGDHSSPKSDIFPTKVFLYPRIDHSSTYI